MLDAPTPNSTFAGTGLRLLLVTVATWFGSVLLLLALSGAIIGAGKLGINDPAETFATPEKRQYLRLLLATNNLFTFAVPALAALIFVYRSRWRAAGGLVSLQRPGLLKYAVAVFLVGLPLIGLSAYLNLQLNLPDWMLGGEEATTRLLGGVLNMPTLPELLAAFFTAAVVPALGEELMFRGVLQRRILGDLLGPHLAIWLAAAIFSTIHFEFAGFLPRFLLGALLGYTYYWTGSLWVPILLHLVFNGLQVVNTYRTGEYTPDTEMVDVNVGLLVGAGVASLVAVWWLGRRVEKIYNLRSTKYD